MKNKISNKYYNNDVAQEKVLKVGKQKLYKMAKVGITAATQMGKK